MSYGAQFLNDNDYIIIDQDYYNFAVHSKGTGTTNVTQLTDPVGTEFRLFVRPQIPASNRIICPKRYDTPAPPAGKMIVGGAASGGSNDYSDFTYEWVYLVLAKDAPETLTDNYGLQVFKDDGTLAFSSRQEIMQFSTFTKVAYNNKFVNVTTPIPPPSKKVFFDFGVVHTFLIQFVQLPGNSFNNMIGVKFTSDNTLEIDQVQDVYPGSGDVDVTIPLDTTVSLVTAEFFF